MNTLEGTSSRFAGGLVHSIEVLRRLENYRLLIFAPEFARPIIREALPQASFMPMPTLGQTEGRSALEFIYRALMTFQRASAFRECDVLYATSQFLPDVMPILCARQRRSTVCIFHVMEPPWKRKGPLIKNSVAFAAEALGLFIVRLYCRSVIAGTDQLKKNLRRRGFGQPIVVTTNGVEHARALEIGNTSRERSGAVFVGRLHPPKGLNDLLRCWKMVSEVVPGVKLTIVGDGEPVYKDSLKRLATELGLATRVSFAGAVNAERRSDLLQMAKIFLFPSSEEGWGIAIAEAMASGLPCVTYDLPVFREVFPCGRISAEPGNYVKLAACAISLLTNDELWRQTSLQAVELAQSFTWERAAVYEDHAIRLALDSPS